MKKRLFIASFDMEIGGVERSLISMLENFDYDQFDIDLHLHAHSGPLLPLLTEKVNLLPEQAHYRTYRLGIYGTLKSGFIKIATYRLIAKLKTKLISLCLGIANPGYHQIQCIWDSCYKLGPKVVEEYDIAISFLWPHHFVAHNVNASKKVAWVHTDYSTIKVNIEKDLRVWEKFDYIICISDACAKVFLNKYPSLLDKVRVVENINSPEHINKMSLSKPSHLFDSNCFNIVSVGRLCYAKGFDRAVEVLAKLHERGYTMLKWYIIGEGGDEVLIKSAIKKYNMESSFILLGSTINPYPFIKAADLYVQPSRYEGKAVTVEEALILGKAVVITNYSTSASQIDNKKNGLICEQNLESIISSIELLYTNSDLKCSFENFNKLQSHSNVDELEKLYSLLR